MRKRKFLAFIPLVVAASLSAKINVPTPSSIAVHDVVKSGTTESVLRALAEKHHVVIGVYGIIAGVDEPTIDISIKKGSLSDVFDAITKADPRFEWEQTSNGSVHFVTPGDSNTLMDVTVHSFDDKNPRVLDFTSHLLRVPEVHGWLQDHKCDLIHRIIIAGQPPQEWRQFSVHAMDVPFSAILDEVAAKSHTYYWSAIQDNTKLCQLDVGWGDPQPK
jgi:hypothetical protein